MAADPLDLERLEQVAKAAAEDDDGNIVACMPWSTAYENYRRAIMPPVAIALIAALRAEQARVREAEMERDRCDAGLGALLHQRTKLEAERDALQAEVRALREQVKAIIEEQA